MPKRGKTFLFFKRVFLKVIPVGMTKIKLGGKIMECSEHPGVKMVLAEMPKTWCDVGKYICPECEEEKRVKQAAGKTVGSQVVFSSRGGWGSK